MEINNVTYSYDHKKNHLDGVNAEIELGKITTIIGPNGCGKSTLLGVISNNYIPHQGQVILQGKKLAKYKSKELAKKVAVVHQQNSAPADMTVERLISYGRLPYKSMFSSTSSKDTEAIEWALNQTNLGSKRNVMIEALSGGERQRVWIAMTLAQSTPYLFLDEPTTYLDIYYQYEILELIKRLNVELGLTIVMVLHDINQAIRYSDTIIAMKDGKIVTKGKPEQIITDKLMKEVYGVDVLIKEDEKTGLYTIPVGI
ncbi:ABC transporter ATP-binding protein [Bacillus sp. FJAT-50079]|uniref:ABC transporter ATP-binding protein n=1 Tax=Bacillus sp. FJAT-50079 TaxID=2833577 RepID=UPI001BC8ECB2|nr:ABC transporter ATP-binding protein [Bacillus sp. FJAT-50079]MBS4207894.1 ABC transporter ATP-binding protein [Bacillus sp. FJAT-50079]